VFWCGCDAQFAQLPHVEVLTQVPEIFTLKFAGFCVLQRILSRAGHSSIFYCSRIFLETQSRILIYSKINFPDFKNMKPQRVFLYLLNANNPTVWSFAQWNDEFTAYSYCNAQNSAFPIFFPVKRGRKADTGKFAPDKSRFADADVSGLARYFKTNPATMPVCWWMLSLFQLFEINWRLWFESFTIRFWRIRYSIMPIPNSDSTCGKKYHWVGSGYSIYTISSLCGK